MKCVLPEFLGNKFGMEASEIEKKIFTRKPQETSKVVIMIA